MNEAKKPILLVDSSKLYYEILKQQLNFDEAEIHHELSAAAALQAAGLSEFAFIITVANLPDMSGDKLVSKLRLTDHHNRCPIVILTSSAQDFPPEKFNASGITEVFQKQEINELVYFMRRFLESKDLLFGRVLYVEDNRAQRMMLTQQFSQWGLQVDDCANADEAWPCFLSRDYDLVITDIELDGHMTGSRFVNNIRRQPPTRGDTPILAVTAFDSVERRRSLFHLGASDYVIKPFVAEELYARIRNLIVRKIATDRDHMLLAATSMAVITADLNGNIETVNPLTLEMFGYSEAELLGQNVRIFLPQDQHLAHDGYIKRYHHSGQRQVLNIQDRELEALRKNGQMFPVRLTVNEIQQGGRRILAGLIRDISQQKEVEKVLEEGKLRALEASRAKSEFLANMSHEIRTPMNGVIGMTEVLLNAQLSPEQEKMARVIHNSANAQLAILNDILDFSKIEAGKLQIVAEAFELSDIINKTCETLNVFSQDKRVDMSCDIDPAIPAVLFGDSLRLRQVLSNLSSNAIKFSSGLARRGQVAIKFSLMEQIEDQYWLDLEVRDNGIGMDAEAQNRLFHPFVQADLSTTRKYGGTGLGLVISQHLVEAMGGLMRLHSEVDVGTTFNVHLPFRRAEATELQPQNSFQAVKLPEVNLPSRAQAKAEGQLILVAEDNETNQEVIRQQLALLGYQCDIAADGKQAMQQWQEGDYGLLLSDIHMPYMDGYRLTQEIRAIEARQNSKRLPILALTANLQKGEAERCQAAGMDGYLAKPVPLSQLLGELLRWFPESTQTLAATEEQTNIDAPSKLPVFDATVLTKMVGDNPALHQRLITKFIDSSAARQSDLISAQQAADLEQIGRLAHSLKSAARSVGALQLGQICEQLEYAAKASDASSVSQLLESFEPAYLELLSQLPSS